MCAHGGTSDPLSRCIIKSKCIGNDAVGDRKSRDTLISQSKVLFHIWSAGEVSFLIKTTVQFTDEIYH